MTDMIGRKEDGEGTAGAGTRAARLRSASRWMSVAAIAVGGIVALAAVGQVVLTAGLALDHAFDVKPEYRKAVGGHMAAAYYADTPELMVEELLKAEAGMRELGLGPEAYCDARPWHHTPDCRMDYQYRELESTIARAQEVIDWREQQGRTGAGDQLGDVYGEKVERIRAFIGSDAGHGGGLDEIAYGAFHVERHPLHAFWWDWWFLLILSWVAYVVAGGLAAFGLMLGSDRLDAVARGIDEAAARGRWQERRLEAERRFDGHMCMPGCQKHSSPFDARGRH